MNDDASLSIASDKKKLVQSTRFKRARLTLRFYRLTEWIEGNPGLGKH